MTSKQKDRKEDMVVKDLLLCHNMWKIKVKGNTKDRLFRRYVQIELVYLHDNVHRTFSRKYLDYHNRRWHNDLVLCINFKILLLTDRSMS